MQRPLRQAHQQLHYPLDVQYVPDATVVIAAIGVAAALYQQHRQHHALRVERTIALHRDLTTGEVGAARERFTTAMWWAGRKSGLLCHQPTWEELDDSPPTPGALAVYSAEVTGDPTERPLRDLYRVLYCFERIEKARSAGAIEDKLAWSLLGHHAVWWDCLATHITDDSTAELGTRHIESLRAFASWARTRNGEFDPVQPTGLTQWAESDFNPPPD